jgi:hypothetical protein
MAEGGTACGDEFGAYKPYFSGGLLEPKQSRATRFHLVAHFYYPYEASNCSER